MRYRGTSAVLAGTLVFLIAAGISVASSPIGFFTAVYGNVSVTHPGATTPLLARLNDKVMFKDLIETRQASRTKALLDDDTVLTLGENSRLEITEHLYDQSAKTRSAVLRLLRGKVRALVAKTFGGSKFEIHTPSAVVAARGTYFVVWLEADGTSGVANIGTHGDVAFSAGGKEVIVRPGQTATARFGAPPELPGRTGDHKAANDAIRATDVPDNIASETTRESFTAMGGTVVTFGSDLLAPVQSFVNGSVVPTIQLTATNLGNTLVNTTGTLTSVPSVISGAINALNAPLNSVLPPLSTTTRLLGPVSSSLSSISTPLTSPLSTTTTLVTTTVSPLLGPITTLK
jgi:FecR-like protein